MTERSRKSVSITQNSTITIAVAVSIMLAVCAGAFWTGKTTSELRLKVEHESQIRTIQEDAHKEWKNNLEEIIHDLRSIVRENNRRIKRLENGHPVPKS